MLNYTPHIQTIHYKEIEIGVLRLDLIHPEISGNKWFKLKYNIEQAKVENKDTLITFGGAYSNHIAATAAACKLFQLKCIGIIRGEKTAENNSTLKLAQQQGMELMFVTREEYKQKNNTTYLQQLQQQYPNAYIIPEGGDNELGAKGCKEIITNTLKIYEHFFCAYGTGTTFKGIANSLQPHQSLTGINVLKYQAETDLSRCTIHNNFHCGGYAKHNQELLLFKQWFETTYHIPLDYIYTAKLFFAVFELINQQHLTNKQKILIIHSGGLQGNKGYEERYNIILK